MSDSKRTGSRDISDLKARLGLKKGAAPATGQTRANGAPSGGVVPPPGLNLPPPPGVQHAPAPVMPNASEDPFGAMNAMAAVGNVQRAPEMVIVHDGIPVENVGSSSTGAKVAKIAIPGLIALIIGLAIGKLGESASAYNGAMSDVKEILGDKATPSTISNIKQTLSTLDTLLDEAKTKNAFRPDDAVNKQLEALSQKLEVKSEAVFRKKLAALDSKLASEIVSFYAGAAEVKSMIDAHLMSAKADALVFKKYKEKSEEALLKEGENTPLMGQRRYAVVVQAPTDSDKGADFGAKIVELGGVYCGDAAKETVNKCPENAPPSAYAYRADIAQSKVPWTKGEIASPGTDAVPAKKLLTLLPGGVGDSLIKGADGVASELYYQRRLRMLYDRVHGRVGNDGKASGGLVDQGNVLEKDLTTETSKGSRFSFFM
jgi:hypothetical protein